MHRYNVINGKKNYNYCRLKYSSKGIRYSAEEIAHSDAFRLPRSTEESCEPERNNAKYVGFTKSQNNLTKFVRTSKVIFFFRQYFWHFRLPCFEKVIQNQSFLFQQTEWRACFLREMLWNQTEFRVVFSSTELFGKKFQEFACIFVPWYGILSIFLFCGMPERNSQSFLFRETPRIPSEQTICFLYSAFRGIIFLLEIPNPTQNASRGIACASNALSSNLYEDDIVKSYLLYFRSATFFKQQQFGGFPAHRSGRAGVL